jgi:hypothetical protein
MSKRTKQVTWRDAELGVLRTCWGRISLLSIAERLGWRRSVNALLGKALRIGLSVKPYREAYAQSPYRNAVLVS